MLDGCVVALGGHTGFGLTQEQVKSVERYDQHNTDTWQLMKSVNMPDINYKKSVLVALDGLIYVFGKEQFMQLGWLNLLGYMQNEWVN